MVSLADSLSDISGKLTWVKIKDDFDSGLEYITNIGNIFYFESNHNAPKYKVVRYDLDHPVSLFKDLLIGRKRDSLLLCPNNLTLCWKRRASLIRTS
jgi:Prolyl oligopeptidase, N-terminal beta-propeller domain